MSDLNRDSDPAAAVDALIRLRDAVNSLLPVVQGIGGECASRLNAGAPKGEVLARIRELNESLRELASAGHSMQYDIEWTIPPRPEWFDHFMDQFCFWRRNRNPLWLERGVFGSLAVRPGGDLLELCCGDGFNALHSYSLRCRKVLAVDFDLTAIEHARRFNGAPNIEFRQCDIRTELPDGDFDSVTWDGAIEHFTPAEIDSILKGLHRRLAARGGILSGYTIRELAALGQMQHTEHEYEFKSKEDLLRFFTPHFKNVKVFETIYPTRHNLYFYCSDGPLPFDGDWEHIAQRDVRG